MSEPALPTNVVELTRHHQDALLGGSAIDLQVVVSRGYRTIVSKDELRSLGFGKQQAQLPALLLPIWGVDGEVVGYQARPDKPRVKKGKAIKYETPQGMRMALDVHPSMRQRLADNSVPLWVTEGIKKGDALTSQGCCTVSLLGVWNWRGTNALGGKTVLADWEHVALNGRLVFIVFDSDVMVKPVIQAALDRLAGFLHRRHSDVRLVYLPSNGNKVGVDDFLAAGGTINELMSNASRVDDLEKPELEGSDEAEASGGKALADRLVQYALDSASVLFQDEKGDGFVGFVVRDRRQLWPLASKAVRRWLTHLMWTREGKAPGSDALKSALGALEAVARFEGESHKLHVRIARKTDCIWYDLGDWRAVKIDAQGWEIVEEPPILFRHFEHQKSQSAPQLGGELDAVLRLLNIPDANQRFLFLAYLVVAMVPDIPRPVCVVRGEHGSGKSTFFTVVRELIDPSQIQRRSAPDNLREFVQAASHNLTLFLDNLTHLPDWLSDALCRLCTGDGFSKRQLYTDDDDVVYVLKGLGGINGINLVATKPDLLDRSLIFSLEGIPDDRRMLESAWWEDFARLKPFVLGAIFTALSKAMAALPGISGRPLPRMADFAQWGLAFSVGLGYTEDNFIQAYRTNVSHQNDSAIESSSVAQAVVALLEDEPAWEGSASVLLDRLVRIADGLRIDVRQKAWPKSASSLTRRLNEVAPNLRRLGIAVEAERTRASRTILLRSVKAGDNGVTRHDEVVTDVAGAVTRAANAVTLQAGDDAFSGNDGIFRSIPSGAHEHGFDRCSLCAESAQKYDPEGAGYCEEHWPSRSDELAGDDWITEVTG